MSWQPDDLRDSNIDNTNNNRLAASIQSSKSQSASPTYKQSLALACSSLDSLSMYTCNNQFELVNHRDIINQLLSNASTSLQQSNNDKQNSQQLFQNQASNYHRNEVPWSTQANNLNVTSLNELNHLYSDNNNNNIPTRKEIYQGVCGQNQANCCMLEDRSKNNDGCNNELKSKHVLNFDNIIGFDERCQRIRQDDYINQQQQQSSNLSLSDNQLLLSTMPRITQSNTNISSNSTSLYEQYSNYNSRTFNCDSLTAFDLHSAPSTFSQPTMNENRILDSQSLSVYSDEKFQPHNTLSLSSSSNRNLQHQQQHGLLSLNNQSQHNLTMPPTSLSSLLFSSSVASCNQESSTTILTKPQHEHYKRIPRTNSSLFSAAIGSENQNRINASYSSLQNQLQTKTINKQSQLELLTDDSIFRDVSTFDCNATTSQQDQQQQQQLLRAHSILVNSSSFDCERFSRKVFVGGLPPDIDEDEIRLSFGRFGRLNVDWPHKAESKSYFPPKGYAFLLFYDEKSVASLVDACIRQNDKLYLSVSSPTTKDKLVQIRPWRLADANCVLNASSILDPRRTVFVGGVPRPLKASELAQLMDELYGNVCYAGIDVDPELKYPKGAGRVAFSSQNSYLAAISLRFVQLRHCEFEKRVEVKPYVLDDQTCDECNGERSANKFAPFFCANITCLRYYCEFCWSLVHHNNKSDDFSKRFHKPLVKESADRSDRTHNNTNNYSNYQHGFNNQQSNNLALFNNNNNNNINNTNRKTLAQQQQFLSTQSPQTLTSSSSKSFS